MQSVIYLFVSPSGRAYAGKHAHSGAAFPRRGTGPLPSGYQGSGKLWRNVARKHGPAIRWIILRRFGPDTPRATTDAAERRAVRLARSIWADRCMNIRDGGQGLTSEEARAYASVPGWQEKRKTPEILAKHSRTMKAHAKTPEGAAQLARMMAASQTPEVRAKQAASASIINKTLARTPERKAQIARAVEASRRPEAMARRKVANKAVAATPEGLAQRKKAGHTGIRKRRARKALAPFVQPPALTAPGVTLWAYRPPLRLSLSVSR